MAEKIKNSDFVHLHAHSTFSRLDSLITVENLVKTAKKCGHIAIGLTDHGTMAGAIQFIKTCRKHDIKPVLGYEGYLARNHLGHSRKEQPDGRKGNRHVNLFAKNYKGYQNLCRLSQTASLEGYYYDPRIDIELIARHSEGLIATSSCLKGLINWNLRIDRYDHAKKTATIFKDIFGDDFYLEIMYHGIDSQAKIIPDIQRLSKELDIKTVLTNDIHYERKQDAKYHDVILCIKQENRCIKDPKRLKFSSDQFYFKTTEEMVQIFKSLSVSMKNTVEFAEKCDLSELQFGSMHLPVFHVPGKFKNSYDYLYHLARKGLVQRGLEKNEEYVMRLKRELDDIRLIYEKQHFDFSTYFLIVNDILRFARERTISFDVRGSGNGSLLLYCLFVTSIDPLRYELLWSRFVSPDRVSWPDVDIDICYERRKEIEDYVINKYGRESVANVGTIGKLEVKSAVRRAIKILDPSNCYNEQNRWGKKIQGKDPNFQLENDICGTLPLIMKKQDGTVVRKLKDAYKTYSGFQECMKQYPNVWKTALAIEGTIASFGTHAAAQILSPFPLAEVCPLHVPNRKKDPPDIATQYTMEDVEAIGLVKMDFLGLSTETAIDRTIRTVKKNYGITIDRNRLSMDDKETLNLLNRGKTVGVFQCENSGMQSTLKTIGVDSIDDLIVCIAMFRPGPLQFIEEYANRKKGRKEVKPLHPIVEKILAKTQQIGVFQEQVMRLFVDLAGLTETDGYMFVKGCAKKKKDIVISLREKFVKGCLRNKIPKTTISQIWSSLQRHSGYSFNRAHAANYGVKAYLTGYLKVHFPTEFMVSRLSVEYRRKSERHMRAYKDEVLRMGYKILCADINLSDLDWQIIDQQTLRQPLIVKNVGIKAAQDIVQNRPFTGSDLLYDFANKVGPIVNSKVVEAMCEAGMWLGIGDKKKIVHDFEIIRKDLKRGRKASTDLFANF